MESVSFFFYNFHILSLAWYYIAITPVRCVLILIIVIDMESNRHGKQKQPVFKEIIANNLFHAEIVIFFIYFA